MEAVTETQKPENVANVVQQDTTTEKTLDIKGEILKVLNDSQNKEPTYIYKNWANLSKIERPNRSYIYTIIKKAKEEKPQTQTETVTVNDPTPEEIKKAEELAAIKPNDITNALVSGKITKEHIMSIFKIENTILKDAIGQEYQLSDDTLKLLGELGEQPINRLFVKYIDKNLDLYIFIGFVAYAHAPIILKLLKNRKPKQKENKQNDEPKNPKFA